MVLEEFVDWTQVASEPSFLAPWLRDFGAIVGLITGAVGIVKLMFTARPLAYLGPYGHCWRLFVVNPTKRSFIVNRVIVLPTATYRCTAESHSVYGVAAHGLSGFHYVVVEVDKQEEFEIWPKDFEADPSWLLVLLTWQPLGGVPMPRLPIVIYRTKAQVRALRRATSTPSGNLVPKPEED